MRTPAETVEFCDRRLACLAHTEEIDGPTADEQDRAWWARARRYWHRLRAAAAAQLPQTHMAPIFQAAPRRRS